MRLCGFYRKYRMSDVLRWCFIVWLMLAICVLAWRPSYITARPRNRWKKNTGSVRYADLVQRGKRKASGLKVAFGGLVRDNANEISKVYHYIQELASVFQDSRIFFFEKKSEDDTPVLLANIASQDKSVQVLSVESRLEDLSHNSPTPNVASDGKNVLWWQHPSRFRKLSQYRNILLDGFRAHGEESNEYFDLYILLDTDVYLGWDIDCLLTSIGLMESNAFDVICANGVDHTGAMYDTLAFRDDIVSDTLWNRTQFDMARLAHQDDDQPYRATSCFGGLAIHAARVIGGCRYSESTSDCEHVDFYRCLRENGNNRIVVNPLMLVYHGIQWWNHTEKALIFAFLVLGVSLSLAYLCSVLAYGERKNPGRIDRFIFQSVLGMDCHKNDQFRFVPMQPNKPGKNTFYTQTGCSPSFRRNRNSSLSYYLTGGLDDHLPCMMELRIYIHQTCKLVKFHIKR